MRRLLRTKPLIIFFVVFILPVIVIIINENIGKFFLYGFYYIWIIFLGLTFSISKKEKVKIIIFTVLTSSLLLTAPLIFRYNNSITYEPNYEQITLITFGLFIIHMIIGTVTFILTLIHISKKIIKINSESNELLIYLFSFIIYPIGIWIIQSHIAKAIDSIEHSIDDL